MSARVGIYGGTFNPIHLGHLRAAEEVAERLELERVVFVPSGQPPHKHSDDAADPIAPAAERLAWVRSAIACNTRFELSMLEVERAGPSYLVDTLEALGRELALGRDRLLFILGRDAFQEMGGWREPRRLLTLANFAVTTRPPVQTGSLREWLPECVREDVELEPDGLAANHRNAGTRIELVGITALDVSATDLRARVRAGRSLRYLVPEVVRESIEKSNAYASRGTMQTSARQ
ncbi:MAG: nicotinate-nucleotide adenylyltransferase [Myxococcota bacterium]|nr:nicotinate-nucleotide adenylyltransferase [Myxococcota bacterium]